MFWVFNSKKIFSCALVISTVVIMFVASAYLKKDEINKATIETSAKVERNLPIYCVETNNKSVALTINCAWNADDIDLILETLRNHNVKVTFFVVGEWAGENQEAVKKIYLEGHEIGNHSYSHPHVESLGYSENLEEIKKCSDLIEKLTGRNTTLYRGPYGEYNDTVIQAGEDLSHITIQWSIDSLDYTGLTGEQMWERIDKKLQNGAIILMHNGTENTALSLDMIITKIKEKGYEISTVSDLIYKENYSIDSTGKQYLNQ